MLYTLFKKKKKGKISLEKKKKKKTGRKASKFSVGLN